MNKELDALVTPEAILRVAKKNNYTILKSPKLNIWGFRASNRESGNWDDIICTFRFVDNCIISLNKYTATTDPGKEALIKPSNRKGTLILKAGQHNSIWGLGYHKDNKDHRALIQVNPCRVIRDINKDYLLDYEEPSDFKLKKVSPSGDKVEIFDFNNSLIYREEVGLFGMNLHRASKFKILETIGLWSAGCQVIRDVNEHKALIKSCENAVTQSKSKLFNYTLVEEKQLYL